MPARTLKFPWKVDLALTLRPLRHGRGDPTMRFDASGAWRATRTPEGPATQYLSSSPAGVRVEAWGPGAEWLLEAAPDLLGARDDPAALEPKHEVLRHLARRLGGLRLTRSNAVVETLVPTILEQRVTGWSARRSYRRLVYRYGEPAPGLARLRLPPGPDVLAAIPYYDLHALGIEKNRARTVKVACSYAKRLEEIAAMPLEGARRKLLALPGVGAWTTAIVCEIALGDPDAVPLGDFHVPDTVAWNLAGEARGSDERMLELLEPYRGQRGRAIRLLETGAPAAPRFAPRGRVQHIERI